MPTVADHLREIIAEYADVTPAKPRNIKIESFDAIEKAGARARKANPDAPDYREAPFFDPRKRIYLSDFDGAAW